MPVRRDKTGRWRYREVVVLPDGARERVFGSAPKHDNTKAACQQALREHMERLRQKPSIRKEVPTFSEWFQGRFWTEWVLGEENKPSVQGEKESAFRVHLRPALGELGLDEINAARVQQLKAELKTKLGRTGKPLSLKTRNNILAVLSKALRYAEEVRIIPEAPRIRLYKVERPEIVFWDIDEYGRLLVAARDEEAAWHVAVLLAGDAGLRLGEILALGWEDIDLIACKLTVRRQVRRGQEGTPKGRTRRTVPMTERLTRALLSLSKVRQGRVMCHGNGMAVTDGEAKHIIYRMCRSAGLPERAWHVLRHSMAIHAARLGVNPWSLQRWLGHKRFDESMRYVHHAEEHPRPVPPDVLQAGASIDEPDSRIIAMLGARGELGAESSPGGLDCSWQ